MSKETLHSPLATLRSHTGSLMRRVALSGVILAAPTFAAVAGTNAQSEVTGDAIHKLAPAEYSQHTPTLVPDHVPLAGDNIRVADGGAEIFGAVVGGAILGAILASEDDRHEPDEFDEVYIEEIPTSDVIIIDDIPEHSDVYTEDIPAGTEIYNAPTHTEEIYISQPVSHGPRSRYRYGKRKCARRYRSFDWRTGTFMTYRGVRKLCPYLR